MRPIFFDPDLPHRLGVQSWVPWAVWCLLGLVLALGVSAQVRRSWLRWSIRLIVLTVFLPIPCVPMGVEDYKRQAQKFAQSMCPRGTGNALVMAPREPFKVDGFRDASDHDALVNDRLHRFMAETIARNGGAAFTIGVGRDYRSHPINEELAPGKFADEARQVLADKRFSFFEVEMAPQGDGHYTNAFKLNTKSWTGKRYRRYYLAPSEHAQCVQDADGPSVAFLEIRPGEKPPAPARPPVKMVAPSVCLAMEIVDASLSRVQIVADEPFVRYRWTLQTQGVSLPAWSTLRWDRIEVTRDGTAVARYLGYDYPHEGRGGRRCHALASGVTVLGATVVPDEGRPFLYAKSWYQDSAVQRFYEPSALPDQVSTVSERR